MKIFVCLERIFVGIALMLFGFVSICQADMASVYGGRGGYCGSRTANGERVNCGAMTAAHRRLPFGARVRVCHRSCVGRGLLLARSHHGELHGRGARCSVEAGGEEARRAVARRRCSQDRKAAKGVIRARSSRDAARPKRSLSIRDYRTHTDPIPIA
jgi:rare lipoprotein A